jgi:PAS domain S-box-containing protein
MSTDDQPSKIEDLNREIASLRQQNDEYRRLASFPHLNPVSIFEYDLQGKVIFFNPAAQQTLSTLGLTDARSFLPEGFSEVMSRNIGDDILLSVGEKVINGHTFEETIIYSAEFNTIRIYANDITRRKQMEQSLRDSEERYHSLFERMTEGFAIHEMIFDEKGEPNDYRFLDINPAFERLTGLKREAVLGKTYHEVLPQEGHAWVKRYGKVVISGEPVQFEDYSPTLSKIYEIFAYRCAPNCFATIFLDITQRKKMEDDLRTNLSKYSGLFNTLPLGVTITDRNGHIVESNQEATHLLGLSQEELNRRLIQGEEWKVIRPDGTPMPSEEFASVRAIQEQRRVENVEMGVIKDNGQVSWISVTAAPLPLKDFGIVITYNDITRRILAEDELRESQKKLELTVQERTQELQDANIELIAEIAEHNRVASQLVEQTKAVEAERQSFNDVLEILPVYTILLTPDYHVAFANRYFRERFGEDYGRRCYEYLFEREEPCENCETFKVLRTNNRHRWEWTGPDQRNYDVFDFPFKNSDGSALILEIGIDITERKQAEEKLRILNAYNRSLIEASPDALVTITPDGKIGDVNSVTETITGRSRDELIGKDFHNYFTDPEKARSGYQQVFKTGLVRDYELEIQHKDGHITPVTYNASIYRDETGLVAGVFAAARDITEYKRAEEALRKSEQQYRSLVIATSQIVWQTDAQGEVIEDIPMWRDFTGQRLEECMGKGWLTAIHPADQERVAEIWARATETKSFYETECRIRNRRNEYLDFAIRGVPILDKGGNITSWVGTSTDITEKKNYQNQLIQAEKHAVIGRMVGSVTHEINNPLQTIKNCLYLIQQDMQADSPSKEPLEISLSETQRLSNIVGQLRQLYRPQAGQSMETHQLAGIISEVQSLIAHQLNNSQVKYKPAPDIKDYTINCVREQLIEVFLNMCVNAIEAMQPTGGTLSINTVYSRDRNQVGVEISDTGPGVTPEILPHIFEPFVTTKEYGLGLGLSICYGIIQKHGGQITVESQPGQGTSFTTWLPVVS